MIGWVEEVEAVKYLNPNHSHVCFYRYKPRIVKTFLLICNDLLILFNEVALSQSPFTNDHVAMLVTASLRPG